MSDGATIAAVAAVASASASIGAFVVAWRATEIERTKVRLQLHERRIAVFKAVQEALTSVKQDTANIQMDIAKVQQAFQAAWFLFPKSLLNKLEGIHSDLIDLETAIQTSNHNQGGELKKRCMSQLDTLADVFEPHMKLPF